jgi:hypothetical protein
MFTKWRKTFFRKRFTGLSSVGKTEVFPASGYYCMMVYGGAWINEEEQVNGKIVGG